MKKFNGIVLFVLVLILSFAAVASADKSEDYYNAIDSDLLKIYGALVNNNYEEAKNVMPTLRENIYKASRFLTEQGRYSKDLMDVVSLVNTVITNKSENGPATIVYCRCLVAKILLKTTPAFCVNPDLIADVTEREPVSGGSSHS